MLAGKEADGNDTPCTCRVAGGSLRVHNRL